MSKNFRLGGATKKLLMALALVNLILASSCATSVPSPTSPTSPSLPTSRINLNFNVDWKYYQGDVSGADAKAYDDSGWTYVDLPHSTKFVTP